MTQSTTINRREFVALSTATAALTAISSSTLADSISKSAKLPAPTLARILPSAANPSKARLQPINTSNQSSTKLINPTLTLTPLPCLEGRLDNDAAITIELHHPTPNLYSILYKAHNTTIPNQSIPSFGSSITTKAPAPTTTLRITQHLKNTPQSTLITLTPGTHLLAIPTANHSSNPNFRFTSAHLDNAHQITKLTNPMPAASSRCAYFSITINDKNAGE